MDKELRPLRAILEDMVQHTRDNPDHGFNCACKDQYAGELRSLIGWTGDADMRARLREFGLISGYVNR